MITENKIQLEVCKAIIEKKMCIAYADVDENRIAITYDGFCSFFICKNDVAFDLSKVREAQTLKQYATAEDFVQMKISDDFTNLRDLFCRKLENENFEIFVQNGFLKMFEGCTFWYSNSLKAILAKTFAGNPVGFFMIVRR